MDSRDPGPPLSPLRPGGSVRPQQRQRKASAPLTPVWGPAPSSATTHSGRVLPRPQLGLGASPLRAPSVPYGQGLLCGVCDLVSGVPVRPLPPPAPAPGARRADPSLVQRSRPRPAAGRPLRAGAAAGVGRPAPGPPSPDPSSLRVLGRRPAPGGASAASERRVGTRYFSTNKKLLLPT